MKEVSSLDPPAARRQLGHKADPAGACFNRQVRLNSLLSGAQVAQRVPIANGQMGHDLIEPASERGEGRERLVNAMGQGPERSRLLRQGHGKVVK